MYIFFLSFSMMILFMILFSQMNHLLMTFLLIESLMMILIILTTLTFGQMSQFNIFFLMFFLTMSVCEVSISLSLLVMMTRSFGSDMLSLLSLNKC